MKNLSLLFIAFLLLNAFTYPQIITEQSNEPIFFNVKSHDPTIKELPAKSFYESKNDWQYIIDTTWGPGLPLAQKQQIFNAYVGKLEEKFDGFESLGFTTATWDTFKTHYYSKINSTTSRGRFSAIMSHLTFALRDLHTYAYDNVVMNTPLNPKVPVLILGGWINVEHFGAVLTCAPDSSILVLRVVNNHPLNLEPGDIILGYDGVPWRDIIQELIEAELPILPYGGGSESSYRDALYLSAGMNWHLFDTIDILKHSTGETQHLSVAPLLNLIASPMLNNEQLELTGISFPNYWNGEIVTYGILPSTNIGYVYVFSEWPTSAAEAQFNQAITALQNTDGLIVDMRWNDGGWAFWRAAFGILSNYEEYTLNGVFRCNPIDWTLCPTGDSASYRITGNPPDLYERPIAVLLGPTCVSMGDINTYRLSYLSTSRIFGKSSAASHGWNETITNFPDWTLRFSKGDMYHLKDPGNYLNRLEFPVDYPKWFNSNDVANGDDTVVEAALEWINNLVYGHDVNIDTSYHYPGVDTVEISAIVENPNSNNVSALLFIKELNNTVIDSLELIETEIGSNWQGTWVTPNYEDFFKLDIKATDQTTGESFTIENVNRFTTAGPVAINDLEVTYNPFPNTYSVKPTVKNYGQTMTVEDISIAMFTDDSSVTSISGNIIITSIPPGETVVPPGSFTVRVDSNFSGTFHFNFEINSNGWLYWKDSTNVITGVRKNQNIPTSYKLFQNYPNPFNPITTITFGIPVKSFVELKLYDILGREVASLINEEQDAGYHEITFNASKLSSGVYLYQIKAGDFVETKKMVLMK